MEKPSFHAEFLRPVEYAFEPDPRSVSFVRYDSELKGMRPLRLDDHHRSMSSLVLHPGVPEDVIVQFETAKNLFMYAWLIYRFFAVAEHHALSCLEFALRERFGEKLPKKYMGRGGRPTLKPLLRYARDEGHIKNEGFKRWHERAEIRAHYRYQQEKAEEMRSKGLDSIVLDYSEAVVTDQDRYWDYINVLVDTLPETRNHYAHGTSSIHNQVRGTLEIANEIINQVFPQSADTEKVAALPSG
jgi:hypothetical protein